MNHKEDSSFLQGIESRLDSLFGENSEPPKVKQPQVPAAAVEAANGEDEIAEVPRDEIREIPVMKEAGLTAGARSDGMSTQDKSTFIVEIEKRFSAIFGEEVKEPVPAGIKEAPVYVPVQEPMVPRPSEPELAHVPPSAAMEAVPVEAAAEPSSAEPVTEAPFTLRAESPVEEHFESAAAQPFIAAEPPREMMELEKEEAAAPVSSIYRSPLKDMKSIVLSIEWEIDDNILGQFEDEVNKLYLLYTGDRIVQGFLRILRFLGRYIRVRGVSSNQDSVNLLLSVYDYLETVMISEGITEARKHIMLLENIKKYRRWVEHTDLETADERLIKKAGEDYGQPFRVAEEEPSVVMTPARPEEVSPKETPEEAKEAPAWEISPAIGSMTEAEEKPSLSFADQGLPQAEPIAVPEVPAPEPSVEKEEEYHIKAPEILTPVQQAMPMNPPLPVMGVGDQQTFMEAIKNMPPHEAYTYALEEIKKTFQSQLDELKEEIRVLKASR